MKLTQRFPALFSRCAASGVRVVLAAVGSLMLIGLVLGTLALPVNTSYADGPDNADIVVQFGPNERVVRPISFTAPSSGLAALALTGLEVITADFGGFIGVCSIEGVGCPAADCFTCDAASRSWGNSFWNGFQWEGYSVGAAETIINDGAVEGWAYGTFDPPDFAPPAPSLPASPFTATLKALDWLSGQQSETDGGYGSVGNSVEVMMAIGANGYEAGDWRRGADMPSLFSSILSGSVAYAGNGSAAAGKLAVGLSAAGSCYPFGAVRPETYYIEATGIYTGGFGAGGAGPQSWGMLGTGSLSQTIPAGAVDHLKSMINPDGGWGWAAGSSDTNGTALAIQSLIAAGEPLSSTAVVSGLNYLAAAQNSDGGFPYDPASTFDTDSDTNSTAYVVQALLAAGEDPITGTWLISNTNPISYLLSMQLADGSFEWQVGSGPNQLATRQVIPALLGRPFPIQLTGDLGNCPVRFLPIISKD